MLVNNKIIAITYKFKNVLSLCTLLHMTILTHFLFDTLIHFIYFEDYEVIIDTIYIFLFIFFFKFKVNLSTFSFLFSEIVHYCHNRVSTVAELQHK